MTAVRRAIVALSLLAATTACTPPSPSSDTDDGDLIQNRGEGKDQWWEALPRPAWQAFEPVEQSQSWFEVYEVMPAVFAIYEPGQFEEIISYLIVGEERALLFDTGLGIGDMGRVVSELTDLDVTVINSHTHYDHVGGNHQFDDVRGAPTDYTRKNASGRGHDEVAEFVGAGWIWKELPDGFSTTDYVSKPFTIRETLSDGEVLDLGGRHVQVIFTPGHAPDSLCLLEQESRLLFTGDTYYPATLYAHLDGSDFLAYRETAERLAALSLDVEAVLPSHNEPLLEPDGLVNMYNAFEAIASGEASYVESDGAREYTFGGFTILTPDPPPSAKVDPPPPVE